MTTIKLKENFLRGSDILKRRSIFLLSTLFLSWCFFSCSEEKVGPLEGESNVYPVENITVKPIAGGAEIHYSLPKEGRTQHVEAILNTKDGRNLIFKSSAYASMILVEGLSSTEEEEVTLYTVSPGENKSNPVIVKINPLEPPYLTAFESLDVFETFGGIRINFTNDSKKEMIYSLGYYDEDGEFIEYEEYYSSATDGYSYRGFPPVETKFGVWVSDKWKNVSDTLFVNLTPLYEEQIPTTGFKEHRLDNDAQKQDAGQRIERLWDGIFSQDFNNPYGEWNCYAIATVQTLEPRFITLDLGVECRLSRIRLHHYMPYIGNAPRVWEYWGRSDNPPQDGSEEGWHFLAKTEQIKPSLLENYPISDAENWEQGTTADIDPDAPNVRYVRIKVLKDWAGITGFVAAEVVFFGQLPDKMK